MFLHHRRQSCTEGVSKRLLKRGNNHQYAEEEVVAKNRDKINVANLLRLRVDRVTFQINSRCNEVGFQRHIQFNFNNS